MPDLSDLGWLDPALLQAPRNGQFPAMPVPAFTDPMSGFPMPGPELPKDYFKKKTVFDTGTAPIPFGSLAPGQLYPDQAMLAPASGDVTPNAFPGPLPGTIGSSGQSAPMLGPSSPSTWVPTNTKALPAAPDQMPPIPAPREDSPQVWQGPPMLPGMGAAPRGPVAPPGAAPTGSLLDRIGNGINNNADLLLALGAGFAGAPSIGEGMHRAFTNAGPLMGRNQTVDALVSRGMPVEMAKAAASNPAILQQLIPSMFGPKQMKFTQIGEDMMGNKQFGFVDEVRGNTYDMAGRPVGMAGGGGIGNVPIGPNGVPLQGQELMAHLEKNEPLAAAALKDMYEGKVNPNARNLAKLQPLAALVYGPDFDATQYPTRVTLRKNYSGGGKDFQETQALNTVSGHLGHLMESAKALDNSEFKPFNKARNFYSDYVSDNPNLVRFRNDLVTTSNELAKAYHGGHVSDAAYSAFNKSINEAQTPEALKAAVGELASLLQSKIEAKESAYRTGMQNAPLPEDYRAINDKAKEAFQRINDWSRGIKQDVPTTAAPAAAHAAPATAAAPPPGRYIYDPATGTMKLAQ